MPVVYGVMTHEEHPGPDVLLIERLRGVSVEAPARTPERWEQLQEQIVEALLAWHRQDSGGCVGMVDSTQENLWPYWYRQRVEVLWSTLNLYQDTGLTMQDKRICSAPANALWICLKVSMITACWYTVASRCAACLKIRAAISCWRWWGRA
jgi:hypothetical protein